jgi:(5-formylfuran-3-yl)methyl phosphate synthase
MCKAVFTRSPCHLLVSVRSAAEAVAALAGGAHVIDVKEPAHGSLGRADDAVIRAVLDSVAGQVETSAALGELANGARVFPGSGLTWAKWGLAGCGRGVGWRRLLAGARRELAETAPACRAVAAAYADWRRAEAPAPQAVCDFVCGQGWPAFLIDTATKDGTTLLDWLSVAEVERLCGQCRTAGVRVALAGSLGAGQIAALRDAAPDWFAVRGAVCRGGRTGTIDPVAVRRLVDLLAGG